MDKKKINFDEHYDALLRYINEKGEFPKEKEVFEDYNLGTWYNAQFFKLKNNMLTDDEKEKILSLPDLSDNNIKDNSQTKTNLIEVKNNESITNINAITTEGIKITKKDEVESNEIKQDIMNITQEEGNKLGNESDQDVSISTVFSGNDLEEEQGSNNKDLELEEPIKIDNNSSKNLFLNFLKLSKEEINDTLKDIINEEEIKYNQDLNELFKNLKKLTSDIGDVLQEITNYSKNNVRDYHIDGFNGIELKLSEDNENFKEDIYNKFSDIYKTYINSNVNIQADNFEDKHINDSFESKVATYHNNEPSISDTEENISNTSFGKFSLEEESNIDQQISEDKEEGNKLGNESDQDVSISTVFSGNDLEEEQGSNNKDLELEEPIKIKF